MPAAARWPPGPVVLVAGALGMLWIGLRDDTSDLRPSVKFGGQLAVAVLVASAGVRITLFVHNMLFSYGITVLWILAVVNALNFMDNMNGLCAGLGAIGAGWLGLAVAGFFSPSAASFSNSLAKSEWPYFKKSMAMSL